MEQRGTVAVIGGGMAGMGAAYELKKAGFEPTVFESRNRVGGRIWTVRKGDFLMDAGTAVYLGTYRDAIALIHEVGLSDEFCVRSAIGAMPRNGKLHHFDYTKPVRTSLGTKAISWRGKLRASKLGALTFRTRKSLGYDTYDELAKLDTETTAEYARRELGEELYNYCAAPLVSGTWVADPEDCSVALLLWTVRNMLVPNVYNLDSGVVGLPEELARRVDTRLEHSVSNVTDNGSQVEVTFSANGAGERTESFDAAVIATTAEPALELYPQMDDNHRDLYETTRYRRLGSICIGLSRRPPDPATYFLVPPYEDPDTIAVIADHIKARNRAPEGKGLLTVLLSHEYLERTMDHSDDQILEYAIDRASQFHGDISGDIEETFTVRWPESVPALPKGRFAQISQFRRNVDRSARVQFASDLDRIPGLNGALVSGQEAAGRVAAAVPAGSGSPALVG